MPAPTVFETQRILLRNLALAANAQQNYREVFADASLVQRVRFDGGNFITITREKESDYNYAGKGHSFSTESRTIAQSLKGDMSGLLTDWLAGWLAAFAMGSETVVGAAAPYSHTFNFLQSSAIAPVTNIYADDTYAVKTKFLNMMVAQLVLTSTSKGAIKYKASLMGTGDYQDGAMGALPALPTSQYLYGSDTQVLIGPAGAPVTVIPRCYSWETTISLSVAEVRNPGGGITASFLRIGNPTVKHKMVIARDISADIRGYQLGDTPVSIQLNTQSGGNGSALNINLPNCILASVEPTNQDGYVADTITLDENSILQLAGQPLCSLTVVNSVPSYLTKI